MAGEMDETKFREIAVNVVSPNGNHLINRHSELIWRRGWQDALQDNYENTRSCIHDEMRRYPNILNHRIDRHKIAAAFTKAIMEVKPLEIKNGMLNPSLGARLANEALAFLTAVRIVRQFLVSRFRNETDWSEKVAFAAINFPPASEGEYPEHVYKAFFNATHGGLNAFVLANLYFLIESYHLQSLGWNGILPNSPE